MAGHQLQQQRFELKYRISPQTALRIRDFVQSYLVLDENGIGRPDFSYPVHSLYLDSQELTTFWDVFNSNKNRYKLRLRFYDDDPEGPVFFEIKRRSNDAILKQRGGVRRQAVAPLLAGQLPDVGDLFSSRPQNLVAVNQFCRLMMDLRASPKVHVAYMREAWVSPSDNSVRVTLDRAVRTAIHQTVELTTQMKDFAMPFEPQVILEVKFTGRFPHWIREMVELFEVVQCGAAKYADGVVMLNEDRLNPDFNPPENPDALERFLNRSAARRGKSTADLYRS